MSDKRLGMGDRRLGMNTRGRKLIPGGGKLTRGAPPLAAKHRTRLYARGMLQMEGHGMPCPYRCDATRDDASTADRPGKPHGYIPPPRRGNIT